jgi:arylsulfatase A-like enzyme
VLRRAAAPRPYRLLACADHLDKVRERIEANNCRASTRRIRLARRTSSPISLPTSTAGSPLDGPTAPASERPNILLIVTDDQRLQGTMAVMPKTMRWFREGGTEFPHAFATTPVCCPSRASIFSGRYVHNHGVVTNEGPPLDLRYTIQRYLKAAGYRTGLVGKFLNYWGNGNPPDFDRWSMVGGLYYYFSVNEQGTLRWPPGLNGQYQTEYLADEALEFLDEAAAMGSPWFLYLAPTAPHPDAVPARQYENAPVPVFTAPPSYFEADRSDKPPPIQRVDASRDWPRERVETERGAQLRTLMSVDDMVDSVFRRLRELGEDRTTLAFFTSDNGFMWGEHGKTGKNLPYQESTRVPLFIRWPGRVPADAVDDRLAANIDLAPTVLDASRTAPDPAVAMDGRSLLDTGWTRDRILLEFLTGPHWASTQTRTAQYTEWYDNANPSRPMVWSGPDPFGQAGTPVRELYRLDSDPWQLTNLLHDGNAANDPDAGSLSAQLARDRRCVGHGAPNAEPPPCP